MYHKFREALLTLMTIMLSRKRKYYGNLYVFLWVIPWHLNFIYQRCWTLCLFHLHRTVGLKKYLPAYEDGTECPETSVYKIQMPWNYPEESIQHSEHGGSLKSRIMETAVAFLVLHKEHVSMQNAPGSSSHTFQLWNYGTNLNEVWCRKNLH